MNSEFELEGFTELCELKNLKEKCGKRFIINEVEIALFLYEGEVFALNNICPHQHTALIYDGFIEEGCVVCPAHGWMFDIKTGKTPAGGRGLETYPVKIFNEKIFVKVNKKEWNW
jgi:nitrite reductase/ring-hydroxylating ferredoxin subunit